jgi:flavin-dependent dehydrogenase
MDVPIIDTLVITAPNGKSFKTKLPLGGFGISRYRLDSILAEIAKQNGVHLMEETKIADVAFNENFTVLTHLLKVKSNICCAAFGKRSNLDVKWKRGFLESIDKGLNNYIAIKYHIKTDWEKNVIGLHNFDDGYCGISKIEDDKYCLCYMTSAENLKKCNNSIEQLEKTILFKNPHLKNIFLNSQKCEFFPVTISQINFNKKTQVEKHILMLGDSAGMITPLCGNGMSIALHTGKIAAGLIQKFLKKEISRLQMEETYQKEWEQLFAKRLHTGRILQRFFGSAFLSNLFVGTFKTFPFLSKPVIKMTHGKAF